MKSGVSHRRLGAGVDSPGAVDTLRSPAAAARAGASSAARLGMQPPARGGWGEPGGGWCGVEPTE